MSVATNNEQLAIVYIAPDLTPWALSNEPDGLTLEKEVIYNGDFVQKKDGQDPLNFGVNDAVLRHWHDTTQLMLANGVAIPIPVSHTDDPKATQGKVSGSRIGTRVDGKNALYFKMKFNNYEALQIAKANDVSIYVPPKFTDGLGREYTRPIQHVALTAYPTIPNLGPFQSIAASFAPPQRQAQQPPPAPQPNQAPQPPQQPPQATSALLPLAQQLGVPQAETLDDAGITAAIVGVFTVMKDKITSLEGGEPEGDENPNPEPDDKKMAKKLPPAIAASLSSMLKDNRKSKIDALVAAGNILPPVAADLIKEFCGESSLALSLAGLDMENDKSAISDSAFDATIAALTKNKAVVAGEKTGGQTGEVLELSNPILDPAQNPIIAGAERRAKEHREQLLLATSSRR